MKNNTPAIIGLFLRSGENAYQRQQRAAALQEAEKRGFQLVIQTSEFDARRQATQIRDAIRNAEASKMVAILASSVRDEDLLPLVHEAAAAGLDWVMLNDASYLDELRQQYPKRVIFSATCAQNEIGRLQADQIRAILDHPRRVMCITGNQGNMGTRLRLEGLKQGLGDAFELVEVNADWTSEGARRAVESWAAGVKRKEDMPAIYAAQNDEMALGTRQALRDVDSRKDWPVGGSPIVGCDGAADFGQRLIREGRMKATVVMPPTTGVALEWIARARDAGEVPPAHIVLPVSSYPAIAKLKL